VPPSGASVLTFHNHINRDGFFVDGALTRTAASRMHLDPTFEGTVRGNVYASPLYVENGANGLGTLYVATEDDDIDALDEATGRLLWQTNTGTPAQQTGAGCGNISPIGITGTPAIDLTTRLIVFDSVTADDHGNIGTHTIQALSIDDGGERWRIDVATVRDQDGRAFVPQVHNQRSAVLILGGVAYVAYGGHAGDCGGRRGWLVGVPLDGPNRVQAFATEAGIWAPGGPSSDGTSVFVATGNAVAGDSTAWAGSETVYRLPTDLTFSARSTDYWTASNWSELDVNDVDLGGSGPLVVDAPGMSPSTLVVALGKDGNVYLLDRTDLGGLAAAPVASAAIGSGEFVNAAAWASIPSGTYVVAHSSGGGTGRRCPIGTSGDLVTVRLSANGEVTTEWCADNQGQGSPIVTSTDGVNDTLVWTAGAEASGLLHAWDLETGEPVFTGGPPENKMVGVRRFTTPVVVHGRIFVGGDARLFALTGL
jgi:outer membrane protein assembly factor BamB